LQLDEEGYLGYASYLEDIREIQQELTTLGRLFRERLPALEGRGVDSSLLRAGLARLEHLVNQIGDLLELATDPQVDLAYNVRILERQNQALTAKVSELDKTADAQAQELQSSRREIVTLKRQLQDLSDAKTGAIYEEYLSPDLIRKGKPNP
jgi:hypothetical protein